MLLADGVSDLGQSAYSVVQIPYPTPLDTDTSSTNTARSRPSCRQKARFVCDHDHCRFDGLGKDFAQVSMLNV